MAQAQTNGFPSWGIGTGTARDNVRIVGDATQARIETAPPLTHDLQEAARLAATWKGEIVPGTVTITSAGEVTVESVHLESKSALFLASEYRRVLRDSGLVRPESGKRYLVSRSYVALDRAEAERLASIAKTDRISVADVELSHVAGTWALWSDGKLTTSIGLPAWTKQIKCLSADAETLITSCLGSDSGRPEMGWSALCQVDAIVQTTREHVGSHGLAHYAPPTVERLDIRLLSGERVTWWLHTEGYCEGYTYELYSSHKTLLAAIQPQPAPEPEYTPPASQLWEPCEYCGQEPVYLPLHRCLRCWPKQK